MNQKLTISRFILILIVVAVGYYVKHHAPQKPTQPATTQQPSWPAAKTISGASQNAPLTANAGRAIIVNGPNGNENIFASVERIREGKRLSKFRDDGIVFENREGRLPQKPSGYYHEYVHATAGEYGPGAQRIITGANGEVYYTPDHYRSFQKVPSDER